jgi:hypothetical protein
MTVNSEWLSMDSAPTDGSSILLAYEVDYGFEVTIGWFDDAWRGLNTPIATWSESSNQRTGGHSLLHQQ